MLWLLLVHTTLVAYCGGFPAWMLIVCCYLWGSRSLEGIAGSAGYADLCCNWGNWNTRTALTLWQEKQVWDNAITSSKLRTRFILALVPTSTLRWSQLNIKHLEKCEQALALLFQQWSPPFFLVCRLYTKLLKVSSAWSKLKPEPWTIIIENPHTLSSW